MHRKRCFEWKALTTEEDRARYFSEYGVRWTEFARLEYFDLVRYTIVDPMHNLLLGEWCGTELTSKFGYLRS